MERDYQIPHDVFADRARWCATQESLQLALDAVRPVLEREGGVVIARPSECAVCRASYPQWVDFFAASPEMRVQHSFNGQPFLGAIYGLCSSCIGGFAKGEYSRENVLVSVFIWATEQMHQGSRDPVDILELRDGRFQKLAPRTCH